MPVELLDGFIEIFPTEFVRFFMTAWKPFKSAFTDSQGSKLFAILKNFEDGILTRRLQFQNLTHAFFRGTVPHWRG